MVLAFLEVPEFFVLVIASNSAHISTIRGLPANYLYIFVDNSVYIVVFGENAS